VAGGESTWREYLTLPNILKEFNPALIGYAFNDSLGSQRSSQFNVAEPLGMTSDMPFQAKLLVRRMHSDKRVDYENDWKVGDMISSIAIFVLLSRVLLYFLLFYMYKELTECNEHIYPSTKRKYTYKNK
jgi:hypothetical protein